MSMKRLYSSAPGAVARIFGRLKRAGQVTPYSGEARWCVVGRIKRVGQVTIELLLVLPVFMLLLFFIMEMGNMGFQTILAHHCAYELARIGSLVAGPTGAQTGGGDSLAVMKMKNVLGQMFPSSPGVMVEGYSKNNNTPPDPQSGQQSRDWIVTLHYPAKLIFPGSSTFLSDPPKGKRTKLIKVMVRMP
ncbi:MAG: pilus assembly protein, partial [Elusimicrobiota bacterium]|nr:pilus assembly protein [Elusimicrobiota bacterium]